MIGENIKFQRNKKGWTQKQLAEKVGLAEITIRQYENNKREPKFEVITQLAEALGVSVPVLLSDSRYNQALADQQSKELNAFIEILDSIGFAFLDYTYIDDSKYDNPYIIYSKDEGIKICLTDEELDHLISSVETNLESEISKLIPGRASLRNDIF